MATHKVSSSTYGMLVVLSGPSGVGKNTLVKKGLETIDRVTYSISATTRQPRNGEKDGIDYFFISKEDFKERIQRDEFFEWAEVYGNFYGTPRTYVESMLKKGIDVLLDIDTRGAASIRKKVSNAISVFVLPPTADELMNRLIGRGTDSKAVISNRMSHVIDEIKSIPYYDYVIVNADITEATEHLKAIITAERCKVERANLFGLFNELEQKFMNGGGLSVPLSSMKDEKKGPIIL